MKITVFTVTDCQFSKKEIEYLKSHNLQYEEKNLETNKEFLTEMLAISDNFAGTPVTRVEKDDGQIAVLKGFTQDEFDVALGFKKPEEITKPMETTDDVVSASTPVTAASTTDATPPTPPAPTPPQPTVPEPPPISPVVEPPASPADLPPAPSSEPTTPPAVENPPPAPSPANPTDEKLSSVLDTLQTRSKDTSPPTASPNPPPPNMPTIPDPTFK